MVGGGSGQFERKKNSGSRADAENMLTIEINEREVPLKVARHFRGRITCRIWRWLGHGLWGFERWVAGGIVHRTTRRITFGR
jgi:hypothetical protein